MISPCICPHVEKERIKVISCVDTLLLSLWRMVKYSSVKAATFNEAENVENQRSSKILKAAPAQWLSHCEA